jgi:DNA helicase-2/ATP-dependent DNA helicase PcrA
MQKIIPVSIGYGEEYFLAAKDLQQVCWQALTFLEDHSLPEVLAYLKSSDLMAKDSDTNKGVVLTTVHKAKGKEFENVIYYPRKTKDKSNFQNRVVEGIMSSKGINVEEELEEEALRINFVAFTRARENLMIVTDKPRDFLNKYSIAAELEVDSAEKTRLSENNKRAYTLFINKEYDKARELLEVKDSWIIKYVQAHFDSLDRIFYSLLTTDAYEYFTKSILGLWEKSLSMTLGSDVHNAAEAMIMGETYEVDEKTKPYIENVKTLIGEIQADYSENHSTEKSVKCPVSNLADTDDSLQFSGKIDAVFKDGEKYLIVDWKTDWSDQYASKHRQQLELYKRLFSMSESINMDNISVAIGYVGLKHKVHDGTISGRLDMAQPAGSAFNTIMKRVNILLAWRQDVHCFFDDLKEAKDDDSLKRSILEQYEKERQDL